MTSTTMARMATLLLLAAGVAACDSMNRGTPAASNAGNPAVTGRDATSTPPRSTSNTPGL